MSVYTHENVPEEIAARFPGLQNKTIITREQVPAYVLKTQEVPAAGESHPGSEQPTATTTTLKAPLLLTSPLKPLGLSAVKVVVPQQTLVQAPAATTVVAESSTTATSSVTYTHENVPEDVLNRFPQLKAVQAKISSTKPATSA